MMLDLSSDSDSDSNSDPDPTAYPHLAPSSGAHCHKPRRVVSPVTPVTLL